MKLRALFFAWSLIALSVAQAQGVQVAVPPDRFATPGDFVTLVFRLTSAVSQEVEVAASTERGWPVLRQPGTVRLEAGRSTPVVATVEVPVDAPALADERVRLVVTAAGGALERSVVLTVTERIELDLEVPREVTLDVEGLTVVASNRGNASDEVVVELWRGADVLDRRELTLGPGAREAFEFALRDDGVHTVVLTGARGAEVRRGVTVLRFGTPAPAPFALVADASFGIGAGGNWSSAFSVEGALSDFAELDARVDLPGWRRSFADLTVDGGSLRVGGGWRDPFRLELPASFGVAGTLQRAAWGFAAAVGHVDDDRFAGVLAAAWRGEAIAVAGGVGVVEGAPLLALRADHASDGLRLTVTGGYGRGGLAAGVEVQGRDAQGIGDLELAVSDVAPGRGRVDLSVRYRIGDDTLYGGAAWSLDGSVPWLGRLGANVQMASPLAGPVWLSLQAGHDESFWHVAHTSELGEGWRAGNGLGMRWDDAGFGVVLDSSWSLFAAAYLAADARLVYRPATGEVDGRVGARAQVDVDAWSLSASGGWDVAGRSLGTSLAVDWSDGPWRVGAAATTSYGLASAPGDRWTVGASLAGGYTFAIPVAPQVVDAVGGRRVGVLEGAVAVDGEGLPGIVVEVGRYRVQTDERGAFRLELPPGRYRWSVVVASVPIAVRLLDETQGEAEVRLREVTALEIPAARTTVLIGRVLEDSDGDGVADDPPTGVRARLVLGDAEGLQRTVATDAEGAFEVRGLIPGAVSVALVEVLGGASIVGDDATVLVLQAGVPAEVRFLVQPPVVTVQAFEPQVLRIRSVEPESDRVPPGAAPLVRVEVQGAPDAVALVGPDGAEIALERVGDAWTARLPVPLAQPAGVLAFSVVARAQQTEATRRAQLIVDPQAPLLEIASDAPVRAGGALTVSVFVVFEARSVALVQPFGDEVALVEEVPGRWVGALQVPAGTTDTVHELVVRVEGVDGRSFEETLRFRVLAP